MQRSWARHDVQDLLISMINGRRIENGRKDSMIQRQGMVKEHELGPIEPPTVSKSTVVQVILNTFTFISV